MAQPIERAEGLEGEVQRTQQNFDTLQRWLDRQGSNYQESVIIFQVAAALESNELEDFTRAYGLLEDTEAVKNLGMGDQSVGEPQDKRTLDRRYSVQACLLAALEIVKKNRGKASTSAPTPEVAVVQAAVRAGMPEAAPEVTGGRDFEKVALDPQHKYDREKAMRVGDYIEMPAREFRRWDNSKATGDQSVLNRDSYVKVRIAEIDRSHGHEVTIIVEADGTGVRKTVSAGLFYNYYRLPGEHRG